MAGLAILLIRLMGLWLIAVVAAPNLSWTVAMLSASDVYGVSEPGAYMATLGQVTLPALTGLLLIVGAPFFAGLALKGVALDETLPDAKTARATGVFLLGVYMVSLALPTLLPELLTLLREGAADHTAALTVDPYMTDELDRHYGWSLGEVIVGTVLILLSRRL